jgi:hypothetical protein
VKIGNSSIGTYPLQAIIDQMKTKEERNIIIDIVKENVIEMSEVSFVILKSTNFSMRKVRMWLKK